MSYDMTEAQAEAAELMASGAASNAIIERAPEGGGYIVVIKDAMTPTGRRHEPGEAVGRGWRI